MVEAAKRLGIGRTAVYQLINEERLRSLGIGSRRLIPVAALHELVAWAEEHS